MQEKYSQCPQNTSHLVAFKKKNSHLVLHCILSSGFVLLIKIKTCSSALWLQFFIPYVPFYTFFHCIVRSYSFSVGKNIFRYHNNHVTFKSIFLFSCLCLNLFMLFSLVFCFQLDHCNFPKLIINNIDKNNKKKKSIEIMRSFISS